MALDTEHASRCGAFNGCSTTADGLLTIKMTPPQSETMNPDNEGSHNAFFVPYRDETRGSRVILLEPATNRARSKRTHGSKPDLSRALHTQHVILARLGLWSGRLGLHTRFEATCVLPTTLRGACAMLASTAACAIHRLRGNAVPGF